MKILLLYIIPFLFGLCGYTLACILSFLIVFAITAIVMFPYDYLMSRSTTNIYTRETIRTYARRRNFP